MMWYWMRGFMIGLGFTLIAMGGAEIHQFFFVLEGKAVTRQGYLGLAFVTWAVNLIAFARLGSLPRGAGWHKLVFWVVLVLAPALGGWYLAHTGTISLDLFVGFLLFSNTFVGYNMVVLYERAVRERRLPPK